VTLTGETSRGASQLRRGVQSEERASGTQSKTIPSRVIFRHQRGPVRYASNSAAFRGFFAVEQRMLRSLALGGLGPLRKKRFEICGIAQESAGGGPRDWEAWVVGGDDSVLNEREAAQQCSSSRDGYGKM